MLNHKQSIQTKRPFQGSNTPDRLASFTVRIVRWPTASSTETLTGCVLKISWIDANFSFFTKANLGQGAPEVGEIPDAPPRITKFEVPIDALEYAPTTGVKELRHAVANLYNLQYRRNKAR